MYGMITLWLIVSKMEVYFWARQCGIDINGYDLSASESCYMGDDIPDFEVMNSVALAACPSDAAEDADNDGLTNEEEYAAGTNPNVVNENTMVV